MLEEDIADDLQHNGLEYNCDDTVHHASRKQAAVGCCQRPPDLRQDHQYSERQTGLRRPKDVGVWHYDRRHERLYSGAHSWKERELRLAEVGLGGATIRVSILSRLSSALLLIITGTLEPRTRRLRRRQT